jgi:hypothetical protein
MNVKEAIILLLERQSETLDLYRLFQDGSIKSATTTLSVERGWARVAGPVPGAAREFLDIFRNSDIEFVKIETLREAIEVRDMMFQEIKIRIASERLQPLESFLLPAML